MNNREIAHEWFAMGDLDLDSAAFLLGMRPMPVEIICYHCQQCAEKYLKGFIAFNAGEVPRTHDLVALNKLCGGYDQGFAELQERCIDLTDYGVQVRYPFHLDIEESDAKRAIENARKVREFVVSRIN
ncbi:MAG: HEPN domain-containing protein [Bacillota bacterium]